MLLCEATQELSIRVFESLCHIYFGSGGGASAKVSVFVIFFIAFSDREFNSKKECEKKNWG